MKPPPLVLCVWEDAVLLDDGPWVHTPEPAPYTPKLFYQVGFLVGDDPEGVQLCEAWSDGVISPRTQIPRGMVRSVTPLKPTKARR